MNQAEGMNTASRFQGKTILVIGGTTGIGFATAKRFIDEGAARVLITGTHQERLAAAATELGERAQAVRSSVTDASDREALAATVGEHGGAHVVFYNAGIAAFGPFESLDEETFDRSMAINVKGALFTIQALLPHLSQGASVVLNTSINNQVGMPGSSIYAASKAALRSLARTLAAELLPRGVRVNAVSPGPVQTPIYGKLGMSPEQLEQMASQVVGHVPLGRFGRPEEIASAVAFVASSEASFMVGEEVVVDGGWTNL